MGVVGVVECAYAQARKSAIFELEHRQILMQAFARAPHPDAQQKDPSHIRLGFLLRRIGDLNP